MQNHKANTNLLIEDKEAADVIKEANQVTEVYQKMMTEKPYKLGSLEVKKHKDEFKKKFTEALNKIV